jgi:paraquat-inducible protein B
MSLKAVDRFPKNGNYAVSFGFLNINKMGKLLSLGLMLVFGLLVFNMIFGTQEDKENVKKVTSGVKDLFTSTKAKYKAGEYDEAIQKIGDVFKTLKEKSNDLNTNEYTQKISDLEQKKQRLEELIQELEAAENSTTRSLVPQENARKKEEILKEMTDLEREVNALAQEMDSH